MEWPEGPKNICWTRYHWISIERWKYLIIGSHGMFEADIEDNDHDYIINNKVSNFLFKKLTIMLKSLIVRWLKNNLKQL